VKRKKTDLKWVEDRTMMPAAAMTLPSSFGDAPVFERDRYPIFSRAFFRDFSHPTYF
jgi:hypothetical protein